MHYNVLLEIGFKV